jgi:hypothetical protein
MFSASAKAASIDFLIDATYVLISSGEAAQ